MFTAFCRRDRYLHLKRLDAARRRGFVVHDREVVGNAAVIVVDSGRAVPQLLGSDVLNSSAAMPDVVFLLRPWSGTLYWLDPRDIDGGSMVGSRSAFEPERAPCGKIVRGDCYRDTDGEGLVVYDMLYACGCRRTRHEYHDGTVTTREIRHGRRHKVLSDEHSEHPV